MSGIAKEENTAPGLVTGKSSLNDTIETKQTEIERSMAFIT